jgi:hypothetical protein
MGEFSKEEFWSFICPFRYFVIVVWAISLLFVLISVVLLVTGVTEQEVILYSALHVSG